MNIKINYGTGVVTLPMTALDSFDRATKADIKLLCLFCAEPYMLSGESRGAFVNSIAKRCGVSEGQVEESLAFWRGAGVLNVVDSEEAGEPVLSAAPMTEAVAAADVQMTLLEDRPAAEASSSTVIVTQAKSRMLDEIVHYSTEEVERFIERQKDADTYLQECQEVWGGIFNPRDLSVIVSLVDTWGLSWNYIINLLAYANQYFKAKENQGKNINFVHRLAMNYYKEGIITEEDLQRKFLEEERMKDFEQRIRTIFGLGNRNLSPNEKKYFSTWLYEYKYGIEIVEMAYNITIDAKGAPNIRYINGILKKWYEEGYTTLEEIIAKRKQEAEFVRSVKEKGITPDNAQNRVEGILASEGTETAEIRTTSISQDIGIIRRLFDLGNRMLTEGEISAMTKWRTEYQYRYEIIYYAYQITLENCREYNLPYVDAVLTGWHEQNLTTIEAVKAYNKGSKADRKRQKSSRVQSFGQEGSFETEDFFAAAVRRSFGDDFDPTVLNS
ncbi:MAG: DnaD domain protein [Ruminococcaceae bacterium]|nr:DnaD domain protein [Oscillospiraceae bacterium]